MSSAKKNDVKPVTTSNVSSAYVGLRDALSSECEQVGSSVDPAGGRPAVDAHAQEHAGPAADVEHVVARTDRHAGERLLVDRRLLLLAPGPVGGPAAPQRAPVLRARAHGHRGHSVSGVS
jgi:hypothetical protein